VGRSAIGSKKIIYNHTFYNGHERNRLEGRELNLLAAGLLSLVNFLTL